MGIGAVKNSNIKGCACCPKGYLPCGYPNYKKCFKASQFKKGDRVGCQGQILILPIHFQQLEDLAHGILRTKLVQFVLQIHLYVPILQLLPCQKSMTPINIAENMMIVGITDVGVPTKIAETILAFAILKLHVKTLE